MSNDEVVPLTVVSNETEAAMLCGLLESRGIRATYETSGVGTPPGALTGAYAAAAADPRGSTRPRGGARSARRVDRLSGASRTRRRARDRPVRRDARAAAVARGAVGAGRDARHGAPARASAGRHARPAHRRPARAARPRGADVEVVETNRGGKSTFHGAGAARLLPDPRPEAARARREALRARPRGSADPHARAARDRRDAHRRSHRRLADVARRARSPRSACTSRAG